MSYERKVGIIDRVERVAKCKPKRAKGEGNERVLVMISLGTNNTNNVIASLQESASEINILHV